jgi:hypothetical protein
VPGQEEATLMKAGEQEYNLKFSHLFLDWIIISTHRMTGTGGEREIIMAAAILYPYPVPVLCALFHLMAIAIP